MFSFLYNSFFLNCPWFYKTVLPMCFLINFLQENDFHHLSLFQYHLSPFTLITYSPSIPLFVLSIICHIFPTAHRPLPRLPSPTLAHIFVGRAQLQPHHRWRPKLLRSPAFPFGTNRAIHYLIIFHFPLKAIRICRNQRRLICLDEYEEV